LKNGGIKEFLAAAMVVIVGLAILLPYENSTHAVDQKPSPSSEVESVSPIISKILIQLRQCESGGDPNIIVEDDGGSPSYGLFQWKYDSFWHYNQIYKILPDLEYQEVGNVILDPKIQTKLTVKVLTEEEGGWRNWYNCSKKIGLDKKTWTEYSLMDEKILSEM
jgi:hypothetical protein